MASTTTPGGNVYFTTPPELSDPSADRQRALNRDARDREVKAVADRSLAESTRALQSLSMAEQHTAASRESADRAAKENELVRLSAQQMTNIAEELTPRVEHIETMAGLAPGEVTDAQTANLVTQTSTSTRSALNELIGQDDTLRNGLNALGEGATGDGVTDDTLIIQSMIVTAQQTGRPLVFPEAIDGYRITEPLHIPTGINMVMRSDLIYAGPDGQPAVTIGEADKINAGRVLEIRVRRATRSDWLDESDTGVLIYNLQRSVVHIHRVSGFTIGAQLFAEAAGWVYNTGTLGMFFNCRYGVDLCSQNAGWVNENIFTGGQWSNQSALHEGMSRRAIRIRSLDGYQQNANVFHKPSFEIGIRVANTDTTPIEISHGNYNKFYDCRSEASGRVLVRTSGTSTFNYASLTFGNADRTEDVGSSPSTVVELAQDQNMRGGRLVFDSGHLGSKAVPYDDLRTHVQGLFGAWSTLGYVLRQTAGVTVREDSIDIPGNRALGVFVDTVRANQFRISRSTVPGGEGRVAIRCYNASGEAIAHDPENPLVRGTTTGAVTYFSTQFGGVYLTGSDSDGDLFVTVSDTVHHIAVMITSGTFMRFTIHTTDMDAAPTAWSGFPEGDQTHLAIQPPTTGAHNQGRRILNGEPTPGRPQGWVCTASGSPGQWAALPNV